MSNPQITDKEKWECVARWLNRFYFAFANEIEFEMPCMTCPSCGKTCMREKRCPQQNFKIIEQFTGPGTVISPFVPEDMSLFDKMGIL